MKNKSEWESQQKENLIVHSQLSTLRKQVKKRLKHPKQIAIPLLNVLLASAQELW